MLQDSSTLQEYAKTMAQCVKLYYPNIADKDLEEAINYSINKRYHSDRAQIDNSYKKKTSETTLLEIADYINSRRPIVTGFGTIFMNHETVPNPLAKTVQSFLDLRGIHKKEMFKYPKGSEMFEKYNLMQSLDKIDCNGIYGTLGMYTSLIYNVNVASSITGQGRALISAASMVFEMFLANNVKFGSLNEVVEFVNHVVQEKPIWKFNEHEWLDDRNITPEDVFAKLVLTCGYRWIPDEDELDIIWKICNNLSYQELIRVWYKNNLYEFLENSKIIGMVETMLKSLYRPFMNPAEVPEEIIDDLKVFSDLLMEFVYYRYMIIDKIDRCDNMIKSVIMVSDTDSTILSLDAWYRYISEKMSGKEFNIASYKGNLIDFVDYDPESGKIPPWIEPAIEFTPVTYDYDFNTDEVIETYHMDKPEEITGLDNMRSSIINILAFVLDRVINDYMEQLCRNYHSLDANLPDGSKPINPGGRNTKILMKNEFTFSRLLMTQVKKNYASLIRIQEGNIVPEDKQLDIKGIECLTKSTKSDNTKKALKKILVEDILKAPVIDQLKFIKDMKIFEKQMMQSLMSGSREYYKPATIKSLSAYDDPMKIQGVKGAWAWNNIRQKELPAIDLDERNAVDIAKVIINRATAEKIKDKYPDVYENILKTLDLEEFKKYTKDKNGNKTKLVSNEIDAISIPLDIEVPEWLMEFIDYNTLISDNIGGFPYSSIGIYGGIKKNVNYTNTVKL